ncbi:MAG: CDP-alcohol phosphatidyltransferase family protein [Pseudomonadota bacterium]
MSSAPESRGRSTTESTPAADGRASYLTAANGLTLLRLVLTIPSALAIAAGHWIAAAVMFTVAAITDYFDGRLARRHNQASVIGGLFDHATDALYVTSCLAAAALNGQIIALLPVLIPLAFTQYLLDSKVLAGQPLRGNRLGRFNGIAYFTLAGVCIGQPLLVQLGLPLPAVLVSLAALALCATTLLSMLIRGVYWWRLRRPGSG